MQNKIEKAWVRLERPSNPEKSLRRPERIYSSTGTQILGMELEILRKKY
jgi:hypothetical protein